MTDTIRLRLPFEGTYRISQVFGARPEVYKAWGLAGHEGVDWACPTGTPILAMADGIVKRVETVAGNVTSNPYGLHVRLRHPWGETIYAHFESVAVVFGQEVKAGDLLGYSDSTGNSTGPHLHITLRLDTTPRDNGFKGCSDPLPFIQRTIAERLEAWWSDVTA